MNWYERLGGWAQMEVGDWLRPPTKGADERRRRRRAEWTKEGVG